MTQYEKLLKKFLENPDNVDFKGLEKILTKNGYKKRLGKGSHVVYKKGNVNLTIAVHNNDCKLIYKKKVKDTLFDNNE